MLLSGGHAPEAELEARLRAHFDNAQLVELTYAIGCFIGYSKQLIALGLEPEAMELLFVPTPS